MYNFISFDYVHTCEAISKFNLINLSITPQSFLVRSPLYPLLSTSFPPQTAIDQLSVSID